MYANLLQYLFMKLINWERKDNFNSSANVSYMTQGYFTICQVLIANCILMYCDSIILGRIVDLYLQAEHISIAFQVRQTKSESILCN